MMQKKIGRLGQWTKEKLGKEQRTQTTKEFQELEQEMQVRQEGIEGMYMTMSLWIKSMINKREEGKHPIIGAFAQALLNFGERLSSDSTYGQGLIIYGMAHKEISKAQEQLISGVYGTILDSFERSLVQFKDFQTARKKLENRRLCYESASNRLPKAKKEDSRIEEELRVSKAKYEEACENIFNRIYTIQQAEATQFNDLTEFLELEYKYYENCFMIIQNLKDSWAEINDSYEMRPKYVKHAQVSAHAFNNDNQNFMNKSSLPFQSKMGVSPIERRLSEVNLNTPLQSSKCRPVPARRAVSQYAESNKHEHSQESITSKLDRSGYSQENITMESDRSLFSQENLTLRSDYSSIEDQQDESFLSNGTTTDFTRQICEKSDKIEMANRENTLNKNNRLRANNYSASKRLDTRNNQDTQNFHENDYELFNKNKSDFCLKSNTFKSSNTYSCSGVPTLRPYSYLKTTSDFSGLKPSNEKIKMPPRPSQSPHASIKSNNICKDCDCNDFQENVFKKGQCNQCFHVH